jgi:hypothetical protein
MTGTETAETAEAGVAVANFTCATTKHAPVSMENEDLTMK